MESVNRPTPRTWTSFSSSRSHAGNSNVELPRLRAILNPDGMLWVSWPKRASRVATDLTENVVRDLGLSNGLVDVKVAAVDATWSGLKLVYRLKDRPNKTRGKAGSPMAGRKAPRMGGPSNPWRARSSPGGPWRQGRAGGRSWRAAAPGGPFAGGRPSSASPRRS